MLGQVLFLVAVALGFAAAGTVLGRELDPDAARACSFAGLGMLVVSWFVPALSSGSLGIGWLCAYALLTGLGLGPVIAAVAAVDPAALSTAAGLTALTVLGMATAGLTVSRDLARWMRPLSLVVLAAIVVIVIGIVVGGLGALSPVVSIVILVASAGLILVDFNYVRRHATEDDVVWLATGIFISILNIFMSLLSLARD